MQCGDDREWDFLGRITEWIYTLIFSRYRYAYLKMLVLLSTNLINSTNKIEPYDTMRKSVAFFFLCHGLVSFTRQINVPFCIYKLYLLDPEKRNDSAICK